MKFLNLNKVPYLVLTWLTVLIQNRTFDSYNQVQVSAKDFLMNNFNIDYKNYDVIVGYRADDSFLKSNYPHKFENGDPFTVWGKSGTEIAFDIAKKDIGEYRNRLSESGLKLHRSPE